MKWGGSYPNRLSRNSSLPQAMTGVLEAFAQLLFVSQMNRSQHFRQLLAAGHIICESLCYLVIPLSEGSLCHFMPTLCPHTEQFHDSQEWSTA